LTIGEGTPTVVSTGYGWQVLATVLPGRQVRPTLQLEPP
jgi:hypothetical protein